MLNATFTSYKTMTHLSFGIQLLIKITININLTCSGSSISQWLGSFAELRNLLVYLFSLLKQLLALASKVLINTILAGLSCNIKLIDIGCNFRFHILISKPLCRSFITMFGLIGYRPLVVVGQRRSVVWGNRRVVLSGFGRISWYFRRWLIRILN